MVTVANATGKRQKAREYLIPHGVVQCISPRVVVNDAGGWDLWEAMEKNLVPLQDWGRRMRVHRSSLISFLALACVHGEPTKR